MSKKKDLNYIAKIEQAIAEKYGDITIQNPAKFWNEEKEKEYLEEIKEISARSIEQQYDEKVEINGFFIPKKLINKDTNRVCPTCGAYSFKRQDDVYMIKHGCCYKCYLLYEDKNWRTKNGGKEGQDDSRDN
tara:strand:- start:434 stop:829 length:396 start_codon:yes stop_codon:yes gene_type:complete